MSTPAIEPAQFRQVLGHFPTGVAVVTAVHEGVPVGMSIGSFTSVSLDPPLVAFFPARTSSSWPAIEASGAFCANVLAEDQEHLSRLFAGKDDDKFSGVGWQPGPTGSPVLDGVLAWIDCDIERVEEAGDHWYVLGRVRDLAATGKAGGPLVFFRGGYGRFGV